MKKIFILIFILFSSTFVYASKMPGTIESLEAVGKGYIKLNFAKSSPDAVYDYQIVSAADIRRLAGSSNSNICYLFYFTGTELLKIQVTNQSCKDLVKELITAQN